MRADRRDAGPVTSIFSTSCPPARRPSAMPLTVSAESNSASSSLSVRRRLWVKAILLDLVAQFFQIVAGSDQIGVHPGRERLLDRFVGWIHRVKHGRTVGQKTLRVFDDPQARRPR